MPYLNLIIVADWDSYEQLLTLRGESREPRLWFDTNKLGISGYLQEWSEPVKAFIQKLIEDEENLQDAIAIEESDESETSVGWEETKQWLGLKSTAPPTRGWGL